ncbi:Na(+)/H(+) antiporter subunit F1 [Rubeoparvulum massiliense]|uniref:Na(+)/H(+) antiporter subunit F1 n=1 Tax=Rubeoparvulum massiliense TaxID=1631346 RepID=UPI00065E4BD9|nr:Na(+)/H(+) antiporter subunit F1 [Rubeoparvulum massiliense]
MIEIIVNVGLVILAISILNCLYRVLRGPTRADKVIALDSLGVNLIGVIALLSMKFHTEAFADVILLFSILSFIGTVAASKYFEKGVIIERVRD